MTLMSSLMGRSPGDPDIDHAVQTWDYVTQSLCIIMMTLFFGLRLYTRVFVLNGFNKEDCE